MDIVQLLIICASKDNFVKFQKIQQTYAFSLKDNYLDQHLLVNEVCYNPNLQFMDWMCKYMGFNLDYLGINDYEAFQLLLVNSNIKIFNYVCNKFKITKENICKSKLHEGICKLIRIGSTKTLKAYIEWVKLEKQHVQSSLSYWVILASTNNQLNMLRFICGYFKITPKDVEKCIDELLNVCDKVDRYDILYFLEENLLKFN